MTTPEDDPCVCDRCSDEVPAHTCLSPARESPELWCASCRSEAAACIECGEEADVGELLCACCRVHADFEDDLPEHFEDR